MFIGATVLLPEGYDEHPTVSYPVIYEQGHFGLRPPLFMQMEAPSDGLEAGKARWRGLPGVEWRRLSRA